MTAILTAKPADNKTRKEARGEHQQTSAKNVYFPDIISSSIWSADWAVEMIPYSRPLSPKQAAKQAYGGLKAREREIAALIAQGKFNREIADVLVLSERTIETHVSNIMFKLNFTSRNQIAKWAIEKGLTANS